MAAPGIKGALAGMPIVMINMGGEMVYILEQRLRAQKVAPGKGQKVLCDVARTMYYPRLIEELFKPQEMYTQRSTRQIFDRIAHSSIMRLNESSMDKLFDLMTMGFKHQVLSTRRPEEIVGVTLNHLMSLRNVVSSQAPVVELVDEAIARVHSTFDDMSEADFAVLRQTLVNFLQDRRVKVSIFLQESIQASDGSITIAAAGRLAYGINPPGQVRYYAGGDMYRTADLPVAAQAAWTAPSTLSPSGEGALDLGINMYEPPSDEVAQARAAGAPPVARGPEEPAPPAMPTPAVDPAKQRQAAVGELNLLANLIAPPVANDADTFQLKLFQSSSIDGPSTGGGGGGEVIIIDAAAGGQAGLGHVLSDMDGIQAGPAGQEDDLLDLMDQA